MEEYVEVAKRLFDIMISSCSPDKKGSLSTFLISHSRLEIIGVDISIEIDLTGNVIHGADLIHVGNFKPIMYQLVFEIPEKLTENKMHIQIDLDYLTGNSQIWQEQIVFQAALSGLNCPIFTLIPGTQTYSFSFDLMEKMDYSSDDEIGGDDKKIRL